MSSADARCESGDRRRRIVVTGIAGRLGRLVARRLHREPDVQVVGIDRRPFPDRPKDVDHVQVDLRKKKARDVFRAGDVDALVHMSVMHAPRARAADLYSWNVSGTAKLLEYCQTYRVPKVVVLSSANVYGPRPDNAQFLTEEAPLLGAQAMPQMRDLVEVDHMVSSFFWKAQDIETVVLRPVHILGRVHNAPSNYLRLPRVPTLLGFDPMVQVIHELDVVEAIVCALRPGARGVFNVTGPGELPLSAILRELGKPTVPIPHPLAKPVLSGLWRLGLTSFPVPELDFIRYVCMVDGSRARRELGFRPRHTLKETIRAVLDGGPDR
ncbi:MAG: SDR family oxidoreductase [Deltaproteobacteria bacterium]|nr:MAG: SDR family oxidoreductase [Deltaproteobacteria bacterium]